MGADRRGPLAAFIVIAVIAAILLVTTVRSQAAPWFQATVVAGPAIEPHLWDSVTAGVDQVVRDGAVAASAGGPARHRRVAAHPRHPSGVPNQHPDTGPTTPTSSSGHDHGRHLGWSQPHGHAYGHVKKAHR